MKELSVLPGDKISSIEEFESSEGTYESDGIIRAQWVGKAVFDLKNRIVKVEALGRRSGLPKIGDYVTGYVNMVTGSMISMKILYINDIKSDSNLEALYFTRGRKKGTMFRNGDLVRAKVQSLLNANIHVTFRDKNLGVIYTLCHLCGNKVIRIDDSIKCTECGNKDERKLADDFGKVDLILPQYRGNNIEGSVSG